MSEFRVFHTDVSRGHVRPRFLKTNNMFRHDGFCYDLFVRPWKKGNARYEALKWPIGQKHLWERIPYKQYIEAKNQQHG